VIHDVLEYGLTMAHCGRRPATLGSQCLFQFDYPLLQMFEFSNRGHAVPSI